MLSITPISQPQSVEKKERKREEDEIKEICKGNFSDYSLVFYDFWEKSMGTSICKVALCHKDKDITEEHPIIKELQEKQDNRTPQPYMPFGMKDEVVCIQTWDGLIIYSIPEKKEIARVDRFCLSLLCSPILPRVLATISTRDGQETIIMNL